MQAKERTTSRWLDSLEIVAKFQLLAENFFLKQFYIFIKKLLLKIFFSNNFTTNTFLKIPFIEQLFIKQYLSSNFLH